MAFTQLESAPGNNSSQFELTPEGIPLVSKEAKKVESQQFRQLIGVVDQKQALPIYRALKQLESGEFKDSKLRDENNELLIMWHGSPRKFDQFNPNAKGLWKWKSSGVHFSSSREFVQQYANRAQYVRKNIFNLILNDIEKITPKTKWDTERWRKVAKIYNEIIEDLIENGENSKYYDKAYKYDPAEKKHLHERDYSYLECIRGWGRDWFLELFGGEMPTRENTSLRNHIVFGENIPIYQGKGIGKYKYAAVLNIENPFEMETPDMDGGFQEGERFHREKGKDGTILYHRNGIANMRGLLKHWKIKGTKGICSAAVFDPTKIRIIGREKGKNFALNKQWLS